jgi:DNA-directed RNA polymerase subunit F
MVTYTIDGVDYNVTSMEIQSRDWEKKVQYCINFDGVISTSSLKEEIIKIKKIDYRSFLFSDIEDESGHCHKIHEITPKQEAEIKELFVNYFKSLFLERKKTAQNYVKCCEFLEFVKVF